MHPMKAGTLLLFFLYRVLLEPNKTQAQERSQLHGRQLCWSQVERWLWGGRGAGGTLGLAWLWAGSRRKPMELASVGLVQCPRQKLGWWPFPRKPVRGRWSQHRLPCTRPPPPSLSGPAFPPLLQSRQARPDLPLRGSHPLSRGIHFQGLDGLESLSGVLPEVPRGATQPAFPPRGRAVSGNRSLDLNFTFPFCRPQRICHVLRLVLQAWLRISQKENP